jgi:hypothetical protein
MAARLEKVKVATQDSDEQPGHGIDRLELIQELAYLKAESRGFEPGHELEDWLAAEQEVQARFGEAAAN